MIELLSILQAGFPDTLLTLPKLNYLLIRENDFDESEIKETIEKFEQKGVTVQYE